MGMPKKSPMSNKKLMEKACQRPTIKEALNFLGLREAGGNYFLFKKWCATHGLEVPIASNYKKTENARIAKTIPNEFVFKENSTYLNRNSIKKRMINLGIKYECCSCQLGAEWNGKKLVLQLDHINSVYNDNRLENLRFLCPNCHSQTDGYAGRSSKNKKPA